jgi:hypothetical protein
MRVRRSCATDSLAIISLLSAQRAHRLSLRFPGRYFPTTPVYS